VIEGGGKHASKRRNGFVLKISDGVMKKLLKREEEKS